MFCHKCGAQLDEGESFCYRCGTKIVYTNDKPQKEAPPQNTYIRQYESTKQESKGTRSNSAEESATEKKPITKEPSKFNIWWAAASKPEKILAVLVALPVGAVAIYLLVAFLHEFGYLLLGIAVVAAFVVTLITGSEKEKREARETIVKMVVGAAIVIAIALVIALKPDFISDIIQPGAGVRNAYLSQYSDEITIEDAFNNFFANEKWSTYKSEGYSYVVFTGTCEYMGKQADAKITFKITGENFLVDHLDVNGTTQNDLMLYALLEKVYEDY